MVILAKGTCITREDVRKSSLFLPENIESEENSQFCPKSWFNTFGKSRISICSGAPRAREARAWT